MTERLLRFRCAGCGNCCKEPVLPLTNEDARRIADATGDAPRDFVKFLPSSAIAMGSEVSSRNSRSASVGARSQARTTTPFTRPVNW